MTGFKVAGVQMDIRYGQIGENCRQVIQHIKSFEGTGNRLVVFPECTLSGYCFPSLEEARECSLDWDAAELKQIQHACRETQQHVIVGFLERDASRIHNTVACFGPNGIVSRYRKIHLPFLGVDRFTSPGNKLEVFEVGPVKIGMNICYDCSFPEASRVLMLQGADLIVLPTNWPPTSGRTADFIPNARALENNVYFMAINRIGTEQGFSFIGKSKIVDPRGADLVFADHAEPAILTAEIDPKLARQKRLINIPGEHEVDRVLDRRPQTYQLLSKSHPEN